MHLTVSDVAIIVRSSRSAKERTRKEAYNLLQLCDARLKAAGRGELTLAHDVRLDVPAVVRLVWKTRKVALAQWKAAKTAATTLAEYDAIVQDERMAEAHALAAADETLV